MNLLPCIRAHASRIAPRDATLREELEHAASVRAWHLRDRSFSPFQMATVVRNEMLGVIRARARHAHVELSDVHLVSWGEFHAVDIRDLIAATIARLSSRDALILGAIVENPGESFERAARRVGCSSATASRASRRIRHLVAQLAV